MEQKTKIIFLGGLDEIGKNMTAIEDGDDIIVIDCGIGFTTDESRSKYPFYSQKMNYLIQRKEKVKAIFITHGHEDHVGNVGNFARAFPDAKIYGSAFTMKMAEKQVADIGFDRLNIIIEHQVITCGSIEVEAIHVNHSIPQAFAYAIRTSNGIIIHSGDVKVDFFQTNEKLIDLDTFHAFREEGVKLLLLESTHGDKKGHSESENIVSDSIRSLINKYADNRIIFTMFASNVYRLKNIIEEAEKYGKTVFLLGRSMTSNYQAAIEAGVIRKYDNVIDDFDNYSWYGTSKDVIITTGCQAEAGAGLSKLAEGENSFTKITHNDVVIFSSSVIPGNEVRVEELKLLLQDRGAKVIDVNDIPIHATGHGNQSDLKMIIRATKPRFFIPIHGEKEHLKANIQNAVDCGIPKENICLPSIGSIVYMGDNVTIGKGKKTEFGKVRLKPDRIDRNIEN